MGNGQIFSVNLKKQIQTGGDTTLKQGAAYLNLAAAVASEFKTWLFIWNMK